MMTSRGVRLRASTGMLRQKSLTLMEGPYFRGSRNEWGSGRVRFSRRVEFDSPTLTGFSKVVDRFDGINIKALSHEGMTSDESVQPMDDLKMKTIDLRREMTVSRRKLSALPEKAWEENCSKIVLKSVSDPTEVALKNDGMKIASKECPTLADEPGAPSLESNNERMRLVPVGQGSLPKEESASTLGLKLQTFRRMLKDGEYRRGFLAMMINGVGDGLLSGGILFIIAALAGFNPVLSAVGLAVFAIVEIAIAGVSNLHASHLRDNADQERVNGKSKDGIDDRPGRRFFVSGLIDIAAAGILLLGVTGYSLLSFGAGAIFVIIAGAKAIQAYNRGLEAGAWSNIKYNLGSEETQKEQITNRFTIGATETGIGGVLYGCVALGAYMAMWGCGIAFPPLLPFIAIGTIVAGGVLSSLPKIWFGRWEDNRRVNIGC